MILSGQQLVDCIVSIVRITSSAFRDLGDISHRIILIPKCNGGEAVGIHLAKSHLGDEGGSRSGSRSCGVAVGGLLRRRCDSVQAAQGVISERDGRVVTCRHARQSAVGVVGEVFRVGHIRERPRLLFQPAVSVVDVIARDGGDRVAVGILGKLYAGDEATELVVDVTVVDIVCCVRCAVVVPYLVELSFAVVGVGIDISRGNGDLRLPRRVTSRNDCL